MDKREEANRRVAEHVARLRRAIEDGQAEIERQNRAVDETRDHISTMRRFASGERTS